MVKRYMQFNVFINMTSMSPTQSLNDNQRGHRGKRGQQSVKSHSGDKTVLTSRKIRMHFPSQVSRG